MGRGEVQMGGADVNEYNPFSFLERMHHGGPPHHMTHFGPVPHDAGAPPASSHREAPAAKEHMSPVSLAGRVSAAVHPVKVDEKGATDSKLRHPSSTDVSFASRRQMPRHQAKDWK